MDLDARKSVCSSHVDHPTSRPTDEQAASAGSQLQFERSSFSETNSSVLEQCQKSDLSENKQRKNTIEEKKRMRRKRKQSRRRQKMEKKRKEDDYLQHVKTEAQRYRCMARTFWDRWQWELLKRKEAMQRELKEKCVQGRLDDGEVSRVKVPEIDPVYLIDPVQSGKPTEVYVGRGSFSVVRLQFYRGIKVAVKEFLPRSVREDVKNEANILSLLTHPYLPYVFGICTRSQPYRLVLQFHGIDSETITLYKELSEHPLEILNPISWLILCTQLLEAMNYIHNHGILHNDIKNNNVLIARSTSVTRAQPGGSSISSSTENKNLDQHIVLIDFGKATPASQCRRYNLSEPEKVEYLIKYPHIAPEIVHGESKQSTYSDMYSIGKIFQNIFDKKCFRSFPNEIKEEFLIIINKLKCLRWHKRLSAEQALVLMDKLL